MKERPILFSGAMVRAILEGRKTQTRRVMKPQPALALEGVGFAAGREAWRWENLSLDEDVDAVLSSCPYGQPGDRLWVRETWVYNGQSSKNFGPQESRREGYVTYVADGVRKTLIFPDGPMLDAPKQHVPVRGDGEDEADHAVRVDAYYKDYFRRSRPSIFMPRWASRLSLEVTEVCVQRLQDISEDDARAEGVEAAPFCKAGRPNGMEHVEAFEDLWTAINGKRPGCSWTDNPWVWCVSFRRLS